MESRKEKTTEAIEFISSLTEEEVTRLDNASNKLIEVLAGVLPIGDITCTRLINAIKTDNKEDIEYYSNVLELCNKCMAIMFVITGKPDPNEDKE